MPVMVLSILNLCLPLILVSMAFLCFANSKEKAGGGKSRCQIVTGFMKPSDCNSVTEFLTNISGLGQQMRTLSFVKKKKTYSN